MKRVFIIICVFVVCSLLFSEPFPSIAPGTYGGDIVLKIDSLSGAEILYAFNRQGRFQSFDFPIKLNALEGEERSYSLFVREDFGNGIIEEYSYTYIIDKKEPPVPVPDTPPGLYAGDVSLSFLADSVPVYYSMNGSPFTEWDGDPILLQPGNQQITKYRLSSYSIDENGNLSDTRDYSYFIQKEDFSPFDVSASVISPVPGVFANYQYIVIDKYKDLDIYYTIDGSVPGKNSRKYSGPQIIEKEGEINLRIAGFNRQGIKELDTAVNYSVSLSAGRMVSQGSGLYSGSVQIEPQETQLVYTLTDIKPDENSVPFTMPIRLGSIPKSSVAYTLQVSPVIKGKVSDIVFRYTYMVDTRVPSRPRFIINGSLPLMADSVVTMVGDSSSQLFYTTDGSEPGTDKLRYIDGISLELKDEQGSFFLRGIAVDVNGKKSDETSIVIPFDRKPPEMPVIEVSKIPGGYKIEPENKFATKLVYEIGWNKENPPLPDHTSSEWNDSALLLPQGMNASPVLAFSYIDEAGNISEPRLIPLEIDNRQKEPPVISVENGMCTITGEGAVFYEILKNHNGSIENVKLSREYVEPFELSFGEGELTDLTIAAYSLSEDGVYSEYAIYSTVYDTRIPVVPEILNIQNHVVYTTSPIRFKPAPADKGVSLHYTISSDGTEPVNPTFSSPRLENLVVETAEGAEVYYHIKILPYNSTSGRTGELKDLLFAVDRKFPVLPEISGFIEDTVYSSRVGISLGGIEEGHTAYISMTTDGSEPGQPVIFGLPYSGTVYVYPEEGRQQLVRLKIGVQDPAGNTTLDPHEYRFTLDNEPPHLPIVEGLPENGLSTSPVSLKIVAEGAAEISYSLYTNEEWSRRVPGDMRSYTAPIYVDGVPGKKALYYLEVLAKDAVGNTIKEPARYSFSIDLSSSSRIPEPRSVLYGNNVLIEWLPGADIEYSLDNETFSAYTSPLMLPSRHKTLFYRKTGTAAVEQYSLPQSETLPDKIYAGIENGSRVSSKVLVRPGNFPGVVRYEMSVDKPSNVTAFSPEFNTLLDFDVPSGLTRRFYINFKYFESANDLTGLPMPPLTFTIDKGPPGVPGIRESIAGTGDKAQKVVQLYGDGNIYYRFKGSGMDESFKLYDDVIRLDSGDRTFEVYKLEAYAEDSLGNRSPVKTWELIIDQDIVYVSDDGNDYYDGSRLKPVKSLEQALIIAREQGRSTLYVYPGVYPIDRPLDISGIQVVGGYGGRSGNTVITPGEYFRSELGMIKAENGSSSISNITFKIGSVETRSVIFSRGSLYLSNIGFLETDGAEYLLLQDGGNIVIEDISVDTAGGKGIMRQNGGVCRITDSVFSVPGRRDSILPVFSSLRGTMELYNVQLNPGNAKKTQGFYGVDSTLKLTKCTVASGRGTISASAVVMINGTLSLSETELSGNPSARTVSLIDAANTQIEITKSYIHGGSLQGTALLNLRNCITEVTYSTLEGRENSDFFFGVKGDDGSFGLINSIIRGDFTRDATLLEMKGMQAAVNHNVFDVHSGSRFTLGIVLEENSGVIIANNIIINRGAAGTALRADNQNSVIIHNNDLYGWVNFGVIGDNAALSVKDFNLLDGDPLGGNVHQNISEDPARTFKPDGKHLQESSILINRGSSRYTAGKDIDQENRPNPNSGIRPLPDIGVDEVYP